MGPFLLPHNIINSCFQLRLDQPWLACKLPLRATPLALATYSELRLVALATSRLAAPPRPFVAAEPGGDAVAAAAYATAEAAAKAAGVEDVNEVVLLAPPGFGLKCDTYRSISSALAAAAAEAAAGGSSGTGAAADGSSGSGAATGTSLGPLPSIGTGAATSAAGAAGSAARAAVAVAAAAGWAGLPLYKYSLLPGEEAMSLRWVGQSCCLSALLTGAPASQAPATASCRL